ncbi:hypothetical protein [Ilumatobacter coccineus]|uniref:DUF3137 domain-containing protein n=1 Tax=Ilumatobacter coccineus (strain NBRC 103263 / KCTC 29153 / YM16-304) TaxID=1313172 RepID=A0A6C7E7P2_ILUCY|nr:hypothetical protein [Ilumatobacter coccineus]BAN03684.1 hypothetical protein YM304_33700 [Ilumatobacter coccineus YM16-304]
MDVVSLVTLAVLAAGLGVAFLIIRRARLRRVAAAVAMAARYGFQVDPSTKGPPELRFDLFERGKSKKVSFQFWRPGKHDSVFAYEYTTGSGDTAQTHRHTCALVSLPFAAPHTKIGPEGFWSKLGARLGRRDIEVESPRFNDLYRVDSDDERFAITMLDGRAIDWFLRGNAAHAVRFEFWGPWMLCITDRMDHEFFFGFHDWAVGIPGHLPEVLTSLYPI